MKKLIIGSRGSPLAMAQTQMMRDQLQRAHAGLQVDIKIIKTSGDRFQAASLALAGGKGLFTKEIEDQLLAQEVDIAVHSMKDLPTTLPDGLIVGAVPAREDVRDVMIGKRFATVGELPQGARVATSSLRRKAQLLAHRPDLLIEEIRGNVDTRIRKLREAEGLEATILAAAGLNRLGMWDKLEGTKWSKIDVVVMLPAVGQGAIAIECREADGETRELLRAINHTETFACVELERSFLRTLGGGCQVPYAAFARMDGGQLRANGAVFSHDGREARRAEVVGSITEARQLGERLAKEVGK